MKNVPVEGHGLNEIKNLPHIIDNGVEVIKVFVDDQREGSKQFYNLLNRQQEIAEDHSKKIAESCDELNLSIDEQIEKETDSKVIADLLDKKIEVEKIRQNDEKNKCKERESIRKAASKRDKEDKEDNKKVAIAFLIGLGLLASAAGISIDLKHPKHIS